LLSADTGKEGSKKKKVKRVRMEAVHGKTRAGFVGIAIMRKRAVTEPTTTRKPMRIALLGILAIRCAGIMSMEHTPMGMVAVDRAGRDTGTKGSESSL
jgi:hypothetical protein